jgi:hypothetical protein
VAKPAPSASVAPAATDVVRTVGAHSKLGAIGMPVVLLLGLVLGAVGASMRLSAPAATALRARQAAPRRRRR